jgi:MYXO-CTERM domain-containing protein
VLWGGGAAVILVVSLIIVLAAGTRPGYDPYGWLVWGKLTLHWKLDTNGAPSWKPLPFLFTVPYALAGHYALWLWMITSVAASLAGAVFAWRIAFFLVDDGGLHRRAAILAGTVAAIAVLVIRDYAHYVLSSQSDPMIVSLCLAAIDCQLCGRRRWAFWLWVLAALGRPEAWPYLVVYSIWYWRRDAAVHRMIAAGLLLIPLFWFGIPALTAKTWFVAGDNALHSPRELHQSKVYGTFDRFLDLEEAPVWIAALLGLAMAWFRRRRTALLIGAGVVAWVVVEIAFVLHGWPGVPRYLFEPVAAAGVLAGAALGWLFAWLPEIGARTVRATARRGAQLGGALAAAALAAAIIPLVPAAQSRVKIEKRDLAHEQARTADFNRLLTVVNRLGSGRMLGCAKINIPIGYQSVFAWYTGIKIGSLYVNVKEEQLHPTRLLNLYPIHNGWKVFPSNIPAADAARCQGLTLVMHT